MLGRNTSAPAQDIEFVSHRRHVCLGFAGPCVAQNLHTFVSVLVRTYQKIRFVSKLGVVSKTKSQKKAKSECQGVLMCTASRTSVGHSKTLASLGLLCAGMGPSVALIEEGAQQENDADVLVVTEALPSTARSTGQGASGQGALVRNILEAEKALQVALPLNAASTQL